MPQLEVHFSHDFRPRSSSEGSDGPQFHHYLPSQDDGALNIRVERPEGTLRIWFQRKGVIGDDGWIRQDYREEPLDKNAVTLQGVISGGPLFGSFVTSAVESVLIDELRLRKYGAPLGLAFGEQFIRAVVNPHFVRAVASIRFLTGQYWLEPLYAWDGKKESLGVFCQHLQMWWREGDGEFDHFLPAAPDHHFEVTGPENPYRQLPDETRWLQIVRLIEAGYEPSIVGQTLLRAHQLRERGETRLAFVEAVSALEIATTALIRAKLGDNKAVTDAAQSYTGLPFKTKLALVASFSDVKPNDIELSFMGYAIRNGLAHEGLPASPDDLDALDALLRVGLMLTPEPRPVFATPVNINEKRDTVDEWEAHPGPKIRVGSARSRSSPPGFRDWVSSNTDVKEPDER
jgi:hypothetical protein